MELKYTRKDYMDGNCDHDTYYAQFVTADMLSYVAIVIGKDKIIASTDKHFNDIPLRHWDSLANSMHNGWGLLAKSNASTTRDNIPNISLSDKVSALKEAARQIKANPSIVP